MKLTKNAQIVLAARYLKKDKKGKPTEKPENLFRRVAHNIALADAKYKYQKGVEELTNKYPEKFFEVVNKREFKKLIKNDPEIKKTEQEFFQMMANTDFIPNSPTLFNAGRKLQQLAACFVIPVEDDMHCIFKALHDMAIIHKSGGGTGFSFSKLRPKGDLVSSTQGEASGPVSFMKIFDAATEEIKQGGKRRGANMGILRCDHPDIEEFITVKQKEGLLNNFNISVAATDTFMRAVLKNKKYSLINPRTRKKVGTKNARKIFQLICQQAWATADPGIIFLDTINKNQPTPQLGVIESTNPCGEVPLLPYEACNLGSINLAHAIRNDTINYDWIKDITWKAVHFLDNVIDLSNYPLPEITTIVQGNRKVGVGVMGFADMLLLLGISYASKKALQTGEEVIKFINNEAKKASAALAKKRGVFPNLKGSIYDTGKEEDKVRNATRTSVAPTGTISIIAGCSSGIEPLIGLAFSHKIIERKRIFEINAQVLEILKKRKLDSAKLIAELIKQGSVEKIRDIPPEVKKILLVAHQIPTQYHVRMQAAFQKHIDNAVSKTVNLPAKATAQDIEKIYQLAYELGCKGVSIYRYNSKKGQILTIGTETEQEMCPTC